MEELLEKYGLKYEDLNISEKETLNSWLSALQQGQLTLEKLADYIATMRASVEQELTHYDLGSKQDIFLKARLRNYMLLEAFLTTPAKAQAQLESAIKGMA